MIYVVAYPKFETLLARQIDRFRSIHEPERAKLVRPHVTLMFELKQTEPAQVSELCRSVASATPKLSVEFVDSTVAYDPFEKAYKLFLVCGKGKGALRKLHGQLYDGLHRVELNDELPFIPHMTIATHADRPVIEQLDVADIGKFPMAGTIRSLELVELVDGMLNELESVPFSK